MNKAAALWRAAAPRGVALFITLGIFGVFLAVQGFDPLAVYADMVSGAFGSGFSWENTLSRAAPLMLTAMATLIPAQLGMVIIGGEGAWLMGGLGAVISGQILGWLPPILGIPLMLLSAAIAGGAWLALAGVGKQLRGVDPTISSLLLYYVGLGLFLFLVEGPLRDPSTLNKPSTFPIPEVLRIGNLPGLSVHWGLVVGILACVAIFVLIRFTKVGFSARISGGNSRAASLMGLPQDALVIGACALGGALAGMAGGIEVAAVHTNANASLHAGIGFSGILVAFLSRQNPLAVIPVAVILGGIQASGGLLQRRHDLSDASVAVFQGLLFLVLLAAEAWIRREGEK